MADNIIPVDAAAWAAARHDYEFTSKPAAQIAEELALHRRTFADRVRAEGWVRRVRPLPRRHAQAAPKVAAPAGAAAVEPQAIGAQAMAAQIARTIERELSAIDVLLKRLGGEGDERTAEAERVARTLASLTRTLSAVQRMRGADAMAERAESESADDSLPRDIDEFRRELARRIDAFVAGRADAALCDDGEPSGA